MSKLFFLDAFPQREPAGAGGEPLFMLLANGEVQGDAGAPGRIAWQARSAIALEDDQAWWVRLGEFAGRERYAAITRGEARAAAAQPFRRARQAGFLNLFQLSDCSPREQQYAARAAHLGVWLHGSRFCGSCGHAAAYSTAHNKRSCQNPECRLDSYPRIEPAVIVLVVCDTRCLLVRQQAFPPRYIAPIAGFVEAGETPEQAVRREVLEEVGLVVGKVDYMCAQPWPFPASLMLGFIAWAGPGQQLVLSEELSAAEWIEREALTNDSAAAPWILPPPGVIGRSLVQAWLGGA